MIFKELSNPDYEGFDGELIVGEPYGPSVYRDTSSVVMSHDKDEFYTYYVFDLWNRGDENFLTRYNRLIHIDSELPDGAVVVLDGQHCKNEQELLDYEQSCLDDGYEGVVIRSMFGTYKFGRTTMAEENTLKLKRFEDSEAVIISMLQEMENTNEKKVDETGKAKRSIHKEGMVGKDSMGALVVRDCVSQVEFQVGSGFTSDERTNMWIDKEKYIGKIIKYKSFMIGVKDKPRHPIYLGMRDERDM
jgi:DNA ligase-1